MNNIRQHFKRIIVSNPELAITKLLNIIELYKLRNENEQLDDDTNSLILVYGQYRSTIGDFNKGIIRRDDKELYLQKVRFSIIDIIDRIPDSVYELPEVQEAIGLESIVEKKIKSCEKCTYYRKPKPLISLIRNELKYSDIGISKALDELLQNSDRQKEQEMQEKNNARKELRIWAN